MTDYKFKVGDKVKLNQYYMGHDAGRDGVVTEVYEDEGGDVLVRFTGCDYAAYEYRLDLVEEPKPVPKFKVGDKVKQSYPYAYGFMGKRHTVGTVTDVCPKEYSFDYRVDFSGVSEGYSHWGMLESELELVTQRKLIDDYIKASTKAAQPDPVSSPSHYTSGQIECIDYIRSVLSREEFRGWLRGNVIKYQHRYLLKGKPVEDLKKILFYTKELIDLEESF